MPYFNTRKVSRMKTKVNQNLNTVCRPSFVGMRSTCRIQRQRGACTAAKAEAPADKSVAASLKARLEKSMPPKI